MIYVFEQGNIVYDGSLTEEEKMLCVCVDVLPVAESIEGKQSQLKADLVKKELYFEYYDVHPKAQESQPLTQKQIEDCILYLMGV